MDRVVYLLVPEANALTCMVRVTKLMKWAAFSETDFSDLQTLFRPQYASYLQPADRPIIMGLIQLQKRPGETPLLDGDYGRDVFDRMLATGRLFFATGQHIRLKSAAPERAEIAWTELPGPLWQPTLTLRPGAHAFALSPPVYIDPQTCVCGDLTSPLPAALLATWLSTQRLDEAAASLFCLRLAKRFPETTFPTPACVKLAEVGSARPVAVFTLEQRSLLTPRDHRAPGIDLRDRLRLRLTFRYGDSSVAWDAPEATVSHRQGDAILRTSRDRAHEQNIIAQLTTWGLHTDDAGTSGDFGFFNFDSSVFRLHAPRTWRDFLTGPLASLDPDTARLAFAPRLHLEVADESSAQADTRARDDGDYTLNIGLRIANRTHPLLPALHHALRTMGRQRTPADIAAWLQQADFALPYETPATDATPATLHLVALPPSLLHHLAEHVHELFDARPFNADGRTRLSRWRVAELINAGLVHADSETHTGTHAPHASPDIPVADATRHLSSITRLCQRLGNGIAVQPRPAPPSLRAALRPYQQHGLGWLHTLGQVSAGGILADDMGLGKTIQLIAHLLELNAANQLTHGALIVAPTSVIDNWQAELARFAPDLKVARYHGNDRDATWLSGTHHHVTLTTYPLLWRDTAHLASHPWDLAVLDEAQYIKNASARTARAARALNAARRLCLTGTPIENNLQDIWSLFEFLLPGFLGDETTFKQRIAKPLADADGAEAAFADILRERLRRRLAPFVLRRLKEDVLPDLPAKTEVVHAVAMTPAQADRYAEFRRAARETVQNAVRDQGLGGARMSILTQLLRLRQICCDPRLNDTAEGMPPHSAALSDLAAPIHIADSAKLTALLELVEQLQARGSRTLIFSQFTGMLDLISAALRAAGRDHLMLTGQTRNRAELVRRFQAGECPLFLISLRAGGSGLNLTAADSVIHYDPWWNPAVERQATDRSHRIGQTRPVFVYKLIMDDSIESKIQELQRTKLDLVRGLLNEGDVAHLTLDQTSLDYLLAD